MPVRRFETAIGFVELTGLPRIFRAMEQNGSPPPRFDFDPSRTWFRDTLPIHPAWGAAA